MSDTKTKQEDQNTSTSNTNPNKTFDDLVIRDLHKKYYQVQPAQNICKIVYIDTYELPPIALIVEKHFDDITCKLLSYLISEEQINNNVLLTIGWLIYKD